MSNQKRRNNKGNRENIEENRENDEPMPNDDEAQAESDDEDLLNMAIPPLPEAVMQKDGNRMVISHIEVNNFKSYFGHKVIGPFHKVTICEVTHEKYSFKCLQNLSI